MRECHKKYPLYRRSTSWAGFSFFLQQKYGSKSEEDVMMYLSVSNYTSVDMIPFLRILFILFQEDYYEQLDPLIRFWIVVKIKNSALQSECKFYNNLTCTRKEGEKVFCLFPSFICLLNLSHESDLNNPITIHLQESLARE